MTSRWSLILVLVLLLKLPATLRAADPPTTRPATIPAAHEIDPVITEFVKPLEAAAGEDDLRKKYKERHNTLVHILKLRIEGYRKGLNDAAPIFDAVEMVAEAKMNLAQNDQEREATARQLLEVTKFVEDRAQKQLKAGFGSEIDVDRAGVLRENAEIELLKLKSHSSAPATQPR